MSMSTNTIDIRVPERPTSRGLRGVPMAAPVHTTARRSPTALVAAFDLGALALALAFAGRPTAVAWAYLSVAFAALVIGQASRLRLALRVGEDLRFILTA